MNIPPAFRHRHVYRALSLILAVGLLWLAFRGVNLHELWETLSQAKPLYIALTFAAVVAACCLRGLRWWILLSSEGSVSLRSALWASMAGQMVNSFVPARGGDLFRVAYIAGNERISKVFALGTTLVERIVDMAVITVFGVFAMTRVSEIAPSIRLGTLIVALCSFAGVVVIITAVRFKLPLGRLVQRLPMPESMRDRVAEALPNFILGLRGMSQPATAAAFLSVTTAVWLVDAAYAMTWAYAMGLELGLFQALLLNFVLAMTQIVPTTPGGLGVNQVLALAVLTPIGFSQAETLAYIVSAQAFFLIIIALLGFAAVMRLRLEGRQVDTNSPTKNHERKDPYGR
jgi:uncharacterized protein (TIRG00374 family)